MRSIKSLVREARESAKWRGHSMPPVRIHHMINGLTGVDKAIALSECRVCHAYIMCETHPAPNSIDISGAAVAVNCPQGKDRY